MSTTRTASLRSTVIPAPPQSRLAQMVAAVSLALGGLLNGGSQYLVHLLSGDSDFSEQIRWAADHQAVHEAEQLALLASVLFLPLAFLGLAHLSRWRSPRLTVAALALTMWGMWGFHTILALGYAAGSVAPGPLGVEGAVALNEAFPDHPGVIVMALVPHLVGSFLGLLLLSVACWRSRTVSRVPLVLLVMFLLWDFLAPAIGPLEPHLLLAVALVWLGVDVARLPHATWSAGPAATTAPNAPILEL